MFKRKNKEERMEMSPVYTESDSTFFVKLENYYVIGNVVEVSFAQDKISVNEKYIFVKGTEGFFTYNNKILLTKTENRALKITEKLTLNRGQPTPNLTTVYPIYHIQATERILYDE